MREKPKHLTAAEYVSGGAEQPQDKNNASAHGMKTYRLPIDLIRQLKFFVAQKNLENIARITETEIVSEALRKHLNT